MTKRLGVVLCLCAACVSFLFPFSANGEQGQEPKRPTQEEAQQRMDTAMQQMGPAMSSMMEGMMGGMTSVLARPETADKLATFAKNYYDALVRKGFSKEEALQIVVHVGIPSTGR